MAPPAEPDRSATLQTQPRSRCHSASVNLGYGTPARYAFRKAQGSPYETNQRRPTRSCSWHMEVERSVMTNLRRHPTGVIRLHKDAMDRRRRTARMPQAAKPSRPSDER